ncbi:MAG TPA: hypothetical protein VFD32_15000 [Dehalococcoidia bacterium]|nr:hypothetical protein [Dehalococcoidia bacterium]
MSHLNEQASLVEVIAELRGLIAERFPQASFAVFEGDDPAGLYLEATADLEDSEELLDPIRERLLELHVEERLPVYVLTAQPLGRIAAERGAPSVPLQPPAAPQS